VTRHLAPSAATIAVVVDPAVTMAMPYEIWAANNTTNHAANDGARRSGNDGAGSGTDGNAFQRPSLSYDRRGRQHQHEYSSLEHRAHRNLLG
jgi:hypothetical protein